MTRPKGTNPYYYYFNDDSPIDYVPPVSTVDPRYAACSDHRVGCDCREAALSEEIRECHLERKALARAIGDVLAGHPIYGRDDRPGCQCTGCEITRRAHMSHYVNF